MPRRSIGKGVYNKEIQERGTDASIEDRAVGVINRPINIDQQAWKMRKIDIVEFEKFDILDPRDARWRHRWQDERRW